MHPLADIFFRRVEQESVIRYAEWPVRYYGFFAVLLIVGYRTDTLCQFLDAHGVVCGNAEFNSFTDVLITFCYPVRDGVVRPNYGDSL